jgi:hypothetical protein
MSGTHTENAIFKYKTKTGFYSPTYSCANLASSERSSELNSQTPLAGQTTRDALSKKTKRRVLWPSKPDKQESSPLPTPFSLSLAIANHPDDSLVGTEVLEGQVLDRRRRDGSAVQYQYVILYRFNRVELKTVFIFPYKETHLYCI